MSQLDAHRRYLERLKKRRNDSSYIQQASWLIKQQAPEFRHMGQQYEQYLEREDAPETAKAQAVIEQQQQWAKTVSGAVEPARLREEQHRKAVGEQIEEAEFKIDIMEEQKKEQEEAGKRNFWKNILKTGGALAGAALAIPTGGASLAAGAAAAGGTAAAGLSIAGGAAIGGLAGSVIGEFAYGAEYFEPMGIVQGMSDVAIELATGADLKQDEQINMLMSQLALSPSFIEQASNWNEMQEAVFQSDFINLSYPQLMEKYGGFIQGEAI